MAEIKKIGDAEQMIIHMYLNGATLRELQKVDGRTHERIRQILLQAQVPMRPTGKRKQEKHPVFVGRISKFYDVIPEMVQRYEGQKESLLTIANLFNTTPMTVRKLLVDAGVTMRSRGPRAVVRENKGGSSEQVSAYVKIAAENGENDY